MNRIAIAITVASLALAGQASATSVPTPAELILNAPVSQADGEAVVEGTEEKSPWTGSIGLGFSAAKTSTNTVGLNFNAAVTREDALSTWNSTAKYVYNTDDAVVQDNFLVVQSDYDRLFAPDSLWNWFANTSYQFNQTESYRQRVKGFGGAGYFLSRTEDLRWSMRGGAGASWDEKGSESGWTPRALLGTRTNWKPVSGVTFEGSLAFEPAFADVRNYLMVLEMKVNVALTMMDNLSMYFTLRDEYNSKPGAGDNYNQVWVTLGFAYGF
jgi:putative salt-induced outer membrane protein YdiY